MAISNKDLNLTIKSKYDKTGLDTATKDLTHFFNVTEKLNKKQKEQLTGIAKVWKDLGSGFKNIGNTFNNVVSGMVSGAGRIFDAIFSIKTLIMSLLAGILAKGIGAFIGLNAEFEKMQLTMDILTKGKGAEWFNALNQWALDMPVSMSEVSKAFITMQAYGLTPSIKLMENFVNVASLLPESGRAITGIARAIGQIQAKTRLEGQELRQLAEWAVPGYEAVYDKIFKKISERTGKAVSDLTFTMIDSSTAIKAILETMEEHFGGAAEAISHTWSGLWIRLTNHVKEFFRQLGESGMLDPFRNTLEEIVNLMSEAFKSGEMQKTAGFIGSSIGIVFEDIVRFFTSGKNYIKDWADYFVLAMKGIIIALAILRFDIMQIKLILLIVKEAWAVFAIVINTILYGIIGTIDEMVQHFKWLVDKLPTSFPGVTALQNAFASVGATTASMAEAQGQNLAILGRMAYETGESIIKISTTNIGSIVTDAASEFDKLNKGLEKFKETAAIPPKKPIVGGGGEFKETPLKPQILTEEEVAKHKKAMKDFREENVKWMLENGSLWTQLGLSLELYLEDLEKNKLKHAADLFKNFFNSIGSAFQTAFSSMIKGTMNLNEGLQSILVGIRDSFLDMISTMVFDWIKGKTLMLAKELFFQKAHTAAVAEGEAERLAIEETSAVKSIAIAIASGIKKIMIYAYEAAAAAFKALAGIPIIGPLLAIGAGAAALGIVMGFAKKVSSFEKGTGLEGIKQTGPALLHKGEIVLNKKESDAYRAGAAGNGQATSNTVNLSFNIQALDGADIEKIVRKKVIPLIRDNIRDNGISRTMVREAI